MRNGEKISAKTASNAKAEEAGGAVRAVKKPETVNGASSKDKVNGKATPVGPIQFPASFDSTSFKFKGEETSDLKLEFTFDAELAKLTEEKTEPKEGGNRGEGPKPIPLPTHSSRAVSSTSSSSSSSAATAAAAMTLATSPATDDLNLKIAAVKNVWENIPAMPTVFEHGLGGAGSGSSSTASPGAAAAAAAAAAEAAEVSSAVTSSQVFNSFATSMAESAAVVAAAAASEMPSLPPTHVQDNSRSHGGHKSEHRDDTPLMVSQSVSMAYADPSIMSRSSEHSNVCKVRALDCSRLLFPPTPFCQAVCGTFCRINVMHSKPKVSIFTHISYKDFPLKILVDSHVCLSTNRSVVSGAGAKNST